MSDSVPNAETYFEKLWQSAKVALKTGEITPAEMINGHTIPINYCLSTVARIGDQPDNPLSRIEAMIHQLRTSLPEQFFYPSQALHISLLGCTPRLEKPSMFDARQKESIQEICARLLRGAGVVEMHLRGLGLIGNQVFIQVFPQDDRWAQLRQTLEAALVSVGEQPIRHADKRPIHLNIMRITSVNAHVLTQLQAVLGELHNQDIGSISIRFIEYLVADFVLSDTTLLSSIDLLLNQSRAK